AGWIRRAPGVSVISLDRPHCLLRRHAGRSALVLHGSALRNGLAEALSATAASRPAGQPPDAALSGGGDYRRAPHVRITHRRTHRPWHERRSGVALHSVQPDRRRALGTAGRRRGLPVRPDAALAVCRYQAI